MPSGRPLTPTRIPPFQLRSSQRRPRRYIRGLLPSAQGPGTRLSPQPLACRSSQRGRGSCAGRPYSARPCRLGPAAKPQLDRRSGRTPLSHHCHSSFQKLQEVGQILQLLMVSGSPHPTLLVWLTQPSSEPLHSPRSVLHLDHAAEAQRW